MIQKAMEYIVGLRKPTIVNVGLHDYTDKQLTHITLPKVETLTVHSLTAVNDFLGTMVAAEGERTMLHIESPTVVKITSRFPLSDMHRDVFLKSEAVTHSFSFSKALDQEEFVVAVQTHFVQTEATARLLKLVGNIVAENITTLADDGVSQQVTTKNGIATGKSKVVVENPWTLKPFRTFAEVDQPESRYFLRVTKSPNNTPWVYLFEVVDNKWSLQAVENIKEWLLFREPSKNIPIIG